MAADAGSRLIDRTSLTAADARTRMRPRPVVSPAAAERHQQLALPMSGSMGAVASSVPSLYRSDRHCTGATAAAGAAGSDHAAVQVWPQQGGNLVISGRSCWGPVAPAHSRLEHRCCWCCAAGGAADAVSASRQRNRTRCCPLLLRCSQSLALSCQERAAQRSAWSRNLHNSLWPSPALTCDRAHSTYALDASPSDFAFTCSRNARTARAICHHCTARGAAVRGAPEPWRRNSQSTRQRAGTPLRRQPLHRQYRQPRARTRRWPQVRLTPRHGWLCWRPTTHSACCP